MAVTKPKFKEDQTLKKRNEELKPELRRSKEREEEMRMELVKAWQRLLGWWVSPITLSF